MTGIDQPKPPPPPPPDKSPERDADTPAVVDDDKSSEKANENSEPRGEDRSLANENSDGWEPPADDIPTEHAVEPDPVENPDGWEPPQDEPAPGTIKPDKATENSDGWEPPPDEPAPPEGIERSLTPTPEYQAELDEFKAQKVARAEHGIDEARRPEPTTAPAESRSPEPSPTETVPDESTPTASEQNERTSPEDLSGSANPPDASDVAPENTDAPDPSDQSSGHLEAERAEAKERLQQIESAGDTLGGDPVGRVELWHRQGEHEGYEGTCGIVSVEGVLRDRGIEVSEPELVDRAIETGNCETPGAPKDNGGTYPSQRENLLREYGVDSRTRTTTAEDMASKVEDGHGVIARVNADHLNDTLSTDDPDAPNHAVVVTGTVRDANGELTGFVVNDSAPAEGGAARVVDADRWQKCWTEVGASATVTEHPRPDWPTS